MIWGGKLEHTDGQLLVEIGYNFLAHLWFIQKVCHALSIYAIAHAKVKLFTFHLGVQNPKVPEISLDFPYDTDFKKSH